LGSASGDGLLVPGDALIPFLFDHLSMKAGLLHSRNVLPGVE
jgi:hypothetical protein